MDLEINVIRQKQKKHNNMPACEGEIIIGDFWETFIMSVEYWSLEDYKRQWKEGLERIKHENVSCLVSSIQDPSYAPLLNWWVLYRIGSKIYIRNQLFVTDLYREKINGIFTVENCYNYIKPRKNFSRSKYQISEWSVDIWW